MERCGFRIPDFHWGGRISAWIPDSHFWGAGFLPGFRISTYPPETTGGADSAAELQLPVLVPYRYS